MKINEVILEAQSTVNLIPWSPNTGGYQPGQARNYRGSNSTSAPTASNPIQPRAQRQSGKRAAALTTKKNIRVLIDTLWGGGIPGKNGKNIINPRMKAALDSKYMLFRNAARYVRLLQWLGYMEFAEAWWKDRAALVVLRDLPPDDPQYAEMHITDEQFDIYTYRFAEEFAVKVAASSIMPGILRWFIRTITFTRYFAALFPAIATGGVGTVASLTLLIGSEYAMTQFQAWLNSQQGKLAVSKAVASLIDPSLRFFASGIESVWDRIKALITGEEQKPEAKPDEKPEAKEKPSTNSEPTSSSNSEKPPVTSTSKPAGQAAKPTNAPKIDWATDSI